MLYRTHISTSLLMGAGVCVLSGYPFVFPFVTGVALGSLLPDIDEPRSYIGRRSFGLAEYINHHFGHRGMTHSIFGWSCLTVLCLIFLSFFDLFSPFFLGISFGYLFHLVGDYFSVSSIPVFYPYQKRPSRRKIAYLTGGSVEKWIHQLSVLLFLYLFVANKMYLSFIASSAQFIEYIMHHLFKLFDLMRMI